MSEEIVFTKKVSKSGKGFLVWIPKDVCDFLKIDETITLELRIKSLSYSNVELPFVKRVSKSGRGYLIWISKDITDYLELNEKSVVQIGVKKLPKKGGNE